jgi:hypothetical protein
VGLSDSQCRRKKLDLNEIGISDLFFDIAPLAQKHTATYRQRMPAESVSRKLAPQEGTPARA